MTVVNVYCAPADISTYAVNAVALTNVSMPDQQAACVAASAECDALGFRDRYPVDSQVFTNCGQDVVMHAARIAGEIVMSKRGYRPQGNSDDVIRTNAALAREWLAGVRRNRVTPSLMFVMPAGPAYQIPQVSTGCPRGFR